MSDKISESGLWLQSVSQHDTDIVNEIAELGHEGNSWTAKQITTFLKDSHNEIIAVHAEGDLAGYVALSSDYGTGNCTIMAFRVDHRFANTIYPTSEYKADNHSFTRLPSPGKPARHLLEHLYMLKPEMRLDFSGIRNPHLEEVYREAPTIASIAPAGSTTSSLWQHLMAVRRKLVEATGADWDIVADMGEKTRVLESGNCNEPSFNNIYFRTAHEMHIPIDAYNCVFKATGPYFSKLVTQLRAEDYVHIPAGKGRKILEAELAPDCWKDVFDPHIPGLDAYMASPDYIPLRKETLSVCLVDAKDEHNIQELSDFTNNGMRTWSADSIRQFINDNQGKILLAHTADGGIAGFVAYTENPDNNTFRVEDIHVNPGLHFAYPKSVHKNYRGKDDYRGDADDDSTVNAEREPLLPVAHLVGQLRLIGWDKKTKLDFTQIAADKDLADVLNERCGDAVIWDKKEHAPRSKVTRSPYQELFDVADKLIEATGCRWKLYMKQGHNMFECTPERYELRKKSAQIYLCTTEDIANPEAARAALEKMVGTYPPKVARAEDFKKKVLVPVGHVRDANLPRLCLQEEFAAKMKKNSDPYSTEQILRDYFSKPYEGPTR